MSISALLRPGFRYGVVAAAIAAMTTLFIALVLSTGHMKLIAVTIGGAIFVVCAIASGNPRLFCVWFFGVTMPLNLSKKFGPILNKGGGETSFLIEVSDVFIIALAGFILWEIWTGARRGFRIPRLSWFWVAIIAMGVVAFVVTPWQRPAAYEVARMLRMLFLFIVLVNDMERPRRLLHYIGAITLGVLGNAVIGLLQYARGRNLGLEILGETSSETIEILASNSVQGVKVWRVSALLLHPNIFGAFLAAVLPLAIGGFLVSRNKIAKLFFLTSATLGTAALMTTQSRSGWASFAAAFGVMILLMMVHPTMRRRSFLPALCSIVAVAVVLAIFAGPITRRLFDSKHGATTAREEFKADARRMIADKPIFGFGLNSYVHALPPYLKISQRSFDFWLPPVHHIYYLWWAETGLVGLALHLAVWWGFIWMGIQNLRVRDEVLYTANAAAVAGLVAFSVDGFFSFTLRLNSCLKTFFLLGAIIVTVRYWRVMHAPPQPVRAGLVAPPGEERFLELDRPVPA